MNELKVGVFIKTTAPTININAITIFFLSFVCCKKSIMIIIIVLKLIILFLMSSQNAINPSQHNIFTFIKIFCIFNSPTEDKQPHDLVLPDVK